ncbi:hypothetical protein GT348_03655 [Aristophania vespae]|uniref:Uncharacterized protein n=1 Tax=Aristophania vespae TaxID=2697033 RepID=A0A6P1NKU0_9PROT|nr:hypothetical protein [Aristophania vespae]QHI95481.1 hypothetical protein GT348_03655 [Aristophania vespae]UMM63053.1 hypothetical protein DM15PD_00060 [Aristophania vespae]
MEVYGSYNVVFLLVCLPITFTSYSSIFTLNIEEKNSHNKNSTYLYFKINLKHQLVHAFHVKTAHICKIDKYPENAAVTDARLLHDTKEEPLNFYKAGFLS